MASAQSDSQNDVMRKEMQDIFLHFQEDAVCAVELSVEELETEFPVEKVGVDELFVM